MSYLLTQPEDFPELEILWLLTRAWNTGILLYSLAQYPEAERWCGLGMSFLRHLGSLQDSYQTQVTRQEANVASLQPFERSTQGNGCHFHFLLASSQVCKLGVFVTSAGGLIRAAGVVTAM